MLAVTLYRLVTGVAMGLTTLLFTVMGMWNLSLLSVACLLGSLVTARGFEKVRSGGQSDD